MVEDKAKKPKQRKKRVSKKAKPSVTKKVINLFEGLKVKSETGSLVAVRECLSPVDQFVFDRCVEGLSTLKAVSSWVGLMKMLNDLNDKADIANVETEIIVDWDESATGGVEFNTVAG